MEDDLLLKKLLELNGWEVDNVVINNKVTGGLSQVSIRITVTLKDQSTKQMFVKVNQTASAQHIDQYREALFLSQIYMPNVNGIKDGFFAPDTYVTLVDLE